MAESTPRYHRSPQREAILDHICSRHDHLSAEEVYAGLRPRFPRLSMGTVYRNLHILVDQERLRVIPFGSGQDRYDARLDLHYHAVCRRCGDIKDLEMPATTSLDIQVKSHSNGFKVEHHAVSFYGLCLACQEAGDAQQSSGVRD
jgi:Fur family peroxide stress response transcriptional regulator